MRRSRCLAQALRSLLCPLIFGAAGLVASPRPAQATTAEDLQIYFIDVEGGQSTLVVTPEHQALLIDTGFAGAGTGFQPGDPHNARDANRIVSAARDAGVSRMDYRAHYPLPLGP